MEGASWQAKAVPMRQSQVNIRLLATHERLFVSLLPCLHLGSRPPQDNGIGPVMIYALTVLLDFQ